jgi:hypothetical protein
MHELKIGQIIKFPSWEALRELQKHDCAVVIAVASSLLRAQSTNGSLHKLLGLRNSLPNHNILFCSRLLLFRFWCLLIWKSKKPSGEWDISFVWSKSAELGYELVTQTVILRDCRALSIRRVAGRRKMNLTQRHDAPKEWEWIEVRRGERKEQGRRLYQQLLLASEFLVWFRIPLHTIFTVGCYSCILRHDYIEKDWRFVRWQPICARECYDYLHWHKLDVWQLIGFIYIFSEHCSFPLVFFSPFCCVCLEIRRVKLSLSFVKKRMNWRNFFLKGQGSLFLSQL